MANNDVVKLIENAETLPATIVTDAMLSKYPAPLQRYFLYTGLIGKPVVSTVRLKQILKMRENSDQPWMQMTARQYYSVQPASFIWKGIVTKAGIPVVRVRDMYAGGKGTMRVKAFGIYALAESGGPEMDTGGMTRYFNEMMWFPSAFLGTNVTFQPIDDDSVKATFTDEGKSVSATMYFDKQGRIINFVAERYRAINFGRDGYQNAIWSTPISEYREFNGLMLPSKGLAVYNLPEGDLVYGDVEITSVEYDVASTF
jgi:hypothetical protein